MNRNFTRREMAAALVAVTPAAARAQQRADADPLANHFIHYTRRNGCGGLFINSAQHNMRGHCKRHVRQCRKWPEVGCFKLFQ